MATKLQFESFPICVLMCDVPCRNPTLPDPAMPRLVRCSAPDVPEPTELDLMPNNNQDSQELSLGDFKLYFRRVFFQAADSRQLKGNCIFKSRTCTKSSAKFISCSNNMTGYFCSLMMSFTSAISTLINSERSQYPVEVTAVDNLREIRCICAKTDQCSKELHIRHFKKSLHPYIACIKIAFDPVAADPRYYSSL